MRKLVASLFVSLDGVIEAPQRWHMPYINEEVGEVLQEQIADSDAFLLGRATYQEWESGWAPKSDEDPMAAVINGRPKYVVTSTLDTLEWKNSRLVSGDVVAAVRQLKAEPGKNIAINGSGTLLEHLLDEGLVDELHLMIHPIVVGTGKRLLEKGGTQTQLRLTSSRTFGTGVVYVVYEPVTG